mgnify:CR=1 FL=1
MFNALAFNCDYKDAIGKIFFVKLRVLSHVLVNFWTSLRIVKREPEIGSVMG